MGQSLLDLIDQNQTQIARAQPAQCRINGEELPLDFINPAGPPGAAQTLPEQRQDFAICASALTRILIEDDIIEGLPEDPGLITEIDIAPIAAVYTYSQSRGLFIGASLEGTVLTTRPNSNTAFYGRPVSPHAILNGSVRPPQGAAPLLGALPGRGRGAKGYAMR
jgi:hypothetical protein